MKKLPRLTNSLVRKEACRGGYPIKPVRKGSNQSYKETDTLVTADASTIAGVQPLRKPPNQDEIPFQSFKKAHNDNFI